MADKKLKQDWTVNGVLIGVGLLMLAFLIWALVDAVQRPPLVPVFR